MQVIGIAGTAKNTGKTTTTAALIEEIKLTGKLLGLTSIGFDGEETDNVTGLPKPRLLLSVGTLVAIAEKCFASSSAEIKVLKRLGIFTPLGEIIIGRVESAGMVVIAGPNKAHQLGEVLRQLQAWQPDIVLVDGALNRLAPMVETSGLILATGAARTPELECLYRETLDLCEVFQWPSLGAELGELLVTAGKLGGSELSISVLDQDGSVLIQESKSLLGNRQVENLMGLIMPSTKAILIPGIVSYLALKNFLEGISRQDVRPVLVFNDPIKLIVSPDFFEIKNLLDKWKNDGGSLALLNNLPLLLVTINPFYPAYDQCTRSYTAAFIDGEELRTRLSKKLKVPVIDVKKQSVKKVLTSQT